MVATTAPAGRDAAWPEEGGPQGRATILTSADVAVGRVTGRPGPCAGRFGDVGSPAGILQVTDTVGSVVRVAGIDGPTGFDLRCQIREALVSYPNREHPEVLPRSNRRRSATPPTDAADRRRPEPLGSSSMLPMIPEAVFSETPGPDPGDGPDPLAATGDDEPGLGWVPD